MTAVALAGACVVGGVALSALVFRALINRIVLQITVRVIIDDGDGVEVALPPRTLGQVKRRAEVLWSRSEVRS